MENKNKTTILILLENTQKTTDKIGQDTTKNLFIIWVREIKNQEFKSRLDFALNFVSKQRLFT